MKIQDFCSKIRGEKNGLFQTLRRLQKLETQVLLDGTDGGDWEPWGAMADRQMVAAR